MPKCKFFSITKFYLIKLLRSLKPDILQTWLIHSDFVGGIAGWLAGIKNIVWNIRSSKLEFGKAKLSTILILKLLSKLSYFIPVKIIIASKNAIKIYKDEKYDSRKIKFIPNGYDLSIYKPNKLERTNFRKKIKVNTKSRCRICCSLCSRKRSFEFIEALSIIQSKNINFYSVFVGPNITQMFN